MLWVPLPGNFNKPTQYISHSRELAKTFLQFSSESQREKTCLWGFRPGPTKNQAVQPQKMAIGLKFRIKEVESLYDLCSQNRGIDLCLVYASAKSRFSHDVAHLTHTLLILLNKTNTVKPLFVATSIA